MRTFSQAVDTQPGHQNDIPLSLRDGTNMTSYKDSLYVGPRSWTNEEAADAIWVLTSTFIIFTMQSGFGLLESGSVSTKNEVNIMVKNAVDVIVGGFAFWMFGYALGFGDGKYSNSFCGWGYFFVNVDEDHMGLIYSKFFFQASFATTATTIVSGAMAERTKLEAYIVFSFTNTFVFCFPAHWVWGSNGWLAQLGFVDIAGAGPVHLVGGVTGLVATLVLQPRHGRFDSVHAPQMGSPTNALLGMFMLWWGWLGFNCGSTFGISGLKWKLAARSAVATLNSSIGGGFVGLAFRSAISTFMASVSGGVVSVVTSYVFERRKFDIGYLINGVLGSLVAITAICALAQPWEGLLIGAIGAFLTLGFNKLGEKLGMDDPVGCVGVHAVSGMWGIISVGLFAKQDELKDAISLNKDIPGLFYGGGPYLLGVQLAGLASIVAWTLVWSFIMLKIIEKTIGLRVSLEHEILGADLVEHAIGDVTYDKQTNKIIGMAAKENSDVMSEINSPTKQHANGSTKNKPKRVVSSLTGFNNARRKKRASVNLEIYKLACELEAMGRKNSVGKKRGSSFAQPRKASQQNVVIEMAGSVDHAQRQSSTNMANGELKLPLDSSSRFDTEEEDVSRRSPGAHFTELCSHSANSSPKSINISSYQMNDLSGNALHTEDSMEDNVSVFVSGPQCRVDISPAEIDGHVNDNFTDVEANKVPGSSVPNGNQHSPGRTVACI